MMYGLGKTLQGLGLLVIFIGLSVSMGAVQLSSSLDSMWVELYGLLGGMALFTVGYLILRASGGPSE
jgi:hypothetical protein